MRASKSTPARKSYNTHRGHRAFNSLPLEVIEKNNKSISVIPRFTYTTLKERHARHAARHPNDLQFPYRE